MARPMQPWRDEADRLDGRITNVRGTLQRHLPRIASLDYKCASMTSQNDSHATLLGREKQRMAIMDDPCFLEEQKISLQQTLN